MAGQTGLVMRLTVTVQVWHHLYETAEWTGWCTGFSVVEREKPYFTQSA